MTRYRRPSPAWIFPEPISAIARRYRRHLQLDEAAELDIKDTSELRQAIAHSAKLRSLGLGPLAVASGEGKIKREAWDSLDEGLSIFQKTALELQLGTPHHVFPSW